MAKNKSVTLVRVKDGREYTTSDPSEINSLRTQGYRVKQSAPKATDTSRGAKNASN